MKRTSIPFALLLAFLLTPGFSHAQPRQPAEDAATHLVDRACAGACRLADLDRRQITEDLALYSFTVHLGPGEHDEIGLFRLIRELQPYVAAPAPQAILFAHGDRAGFAATYLTSLNVATVPDLQALPIFLARNGIDVWGVDTRWARVPGDLSDISFMSDWDLGTDVDDLGVAIGVARGTRLLTGSGFGRIHLSGFSRGGQTAYAYLNAEANWPLFLRQVKGFIPLDIFLKSNDDTLRQNACARVAATRDRIAADDLVSDGQILIDLGQLALDAPAEPSPLFPILTNADLALLVGAEAVADDDLAPFFHPVAGVVDPEDLTTELLYTRDEQWFETLAAGSRYEPRKIFLDADLATCDEEDSPYDDHLHQITVPVLYVGAGGGFGEFGIYNTSLLGSSDVSLLLVDLEPAQSRGLDYGHNDLFLADNAESLVWQPLLSWIEAH